MNKKLISGSFWLSFGSIFSRALGVVYLIPWLYMMGSAHNITTAQALNNSSYTIYAIFLSLGTAGFPSGIARRVAMYNSQQKFKNGHKLFKTGFWLMVISGFFFAALLYFFAPFFAKNTPVVSQRNSTIAIRSLAPAVAILPSMSIIRGWFQGNQDLRPFGISQLWEQIFRVVFILSSTYLLIYQFHASYVIAVYFSVFAAFIGALASYFYLLFHYQRQLPLYHAEQKKSLPLDLHGMKHTLFMIAYESMPFVIVGAGITLCQIVDQLFFKQIMQGLLAKSSEYTQYIYTIFSANPSKITAVIIALATALAETSLPLIAGKNAIHDRIGIKKLLEQNLSYLLFILLPAATMLAVLSPEINGIFFTYDSKGALFLYFNIWQSVIMAIAINGLTLLQSLHYSRKAMTYLLFGLVTKIVCQFPFVYYFQGMGAVLATAVAFGLVSFLSYRKIHEQFGFSLRRLFPIILINIGYFLLITLITLLARNIYLPSGKISGFIFCGVIGIIALVIYLILVNKLGISEKVFKIKDEQ
ncbi:putative polysaccharide biosynthesis protein [Ligilactobacillus acidipiscis]|uniref:putative polysaccharide biosynthesis protein n=1 Tax=Ligilactobacillus acidipiscis TaxID=89059 RepID=UPI0022DF7D24|nr:polysaccharide biosynthesis protein [Ligilactobacillus acidipiscis]